MVATPSTGNGDYDVSAVVNVVNDFVTYPGDVAGKILIVGSTTNPGTCDQLRPAVEARGVDLVYMPTFVAQGTVIKNIENVANLIVGTDDPQIADQCHEIFSSICTTPPAAFVVERKTGEILKLASNCKQTMQISFANMIGQLLLSQGLDNDLVSAGEFLSRAKKEVNYRFGFGYGGPCFPRDNRSLVHFAKSIGMDYPLGELVDQFNQDHVQWITEYLITKNAENLPFYFEYVSYKKGVAQFEESHQLQVCKNLLANGKTVFVEDSEFLLSKIKEDLSKGFTNLVKFVTINNINDNVYRINL
jgi:nucleotide sugar dehydrogenase